MAGEDLTVVADRGYFDGVRIPAIVGTHDRVE